MGWGNENNQIAVEQDGLFSKELEFGWLYGRSRSCLTGDNRRKYWKNADKEKHYI